jgi:archaeosine synthase
MTNREELYRISAGKAKDVRIAREMCFYNPEEVYTALTRCKSIKKWLGFISNHYVPASNKEILLIFPCSTRKPYPESRSYRMLFKTLEVLGDKRRAIHVATISEPFGLIPEEFYGKRTRWHDWQNDWYDCPGLFEWWCRKHKQPYNQEYADKSIELLSNHVADFLAKVKSRKSYSDIIAFVRTYSSKLERKRDHTHRRIIEKAAESSGVKVTVLPPRKVVSNIVKSRGRLAWDLYGVAHPLAQQYLLRHLSGVLNG